MIYTAIDTLYLTEEQLKNSPSRKDGIDEDTETTLRIYGCDLIQESGTLLRVPQAVVATGQALFHRFYCMKSFARFNVKMVAASCVWLASKLEETLLKAKEVLVVFRRMECWRENLETSSRKYVDLKADLTRIESHLLIEMGFMCHVEHPHKFVSIYHVHQFQDGSLAETTTNDDTSAKKRTSPTVNQEIGKDELVEGALHKLKVSKKSNDASRSMLTREDSSNEPEKPFIPDNRTKTGGERSKARERDWDPVKEIEKEKVRLKNRDLERRRESDRERGLEDTVRDRDRFKRLSFKGSRKRFWTLGEVQAPFISRW